MQKLLNAIFTIFGAAGKDGTSSTGETIRFAG